MAWIGVFPKKTYEWYPTLPVIREMQIRITTRCRLAPVSVAIAKKSDDNCRQGCREEGPLVHRWRGCAWGRPRRGARWRCLRKLKLAPPYDPATHFWVLTQRNPKHWFKKTSARPCHCSWSPSMDEWIKKMRCTNVQSRALSSHEKEGNPAICENVAGP